MTGQEAEGRDASDTKGNRNELRDLSLAKTHTHNGATHIYAKFPSLVLYWVRDHDASVARREGRWKNWIESIEAMATTHIHIHNTLHKHIRTNIDRNYHMSRNFIHMNRVKQQVKLELKPIHQPWPAYSNKIKYVNTDDGQWTRARHRFSLLLWLCIVMWCEVVVFITVKYAWKIMSDFDLLLFWLFEKNTEKKYLKISLQ